MTRNVVLISCVSQKQPSRAKAKDLYTSALFKKALAYARTLNPYVIYILSAKHGLLDLETEIEPYNTTLNNMRSDEIRVWAQSVLQQLQQRTDLQNDKFIFLAGMKYRKYLMPHLADCEVPMQELPIGKQMKFLNRHTTK